MTEPSNPVEALCNFIDSDMSINHATLSDLVKAARRWLEQAGKAHCPACEWGQRVEAKLYRCDLPACPGIPAPARTEPVTQAEREAIASYIDYPNAGDEWCASVGELRSFAKRIRAGEFATGESAKDSATKCAVVDCAEPHSDYCVQHVHSLKVCADRCDVYDGSIGWEHASDCPNAPHPEPVARPHQPCGPNCPAANGITLRPAGEDVAGWLRERATKLFGRDTMLSGWKAKAYTWLYDLADEWSRTHPKGGWTEMVQHGPSCPDDCEQCWPKGGGE